MIWIFGKPVGRDTICGKRYGCKFDRIPPVEERMISYVKQIGNPYIFKVADTRGRVFFDRVIC